MCASASNCLPKRLLDLHNGVRLIDTLSGEEAPLEEPYMTLSHCWGTHAVAQLLPKTTHDNIYYRQQGIAWHSLPQLFRDVITLVRALECRYLWIDSLCIIQDDQEDWMAESAKMSEIYHNATLNIAATAMRNASVGLFQKRIHGEGFRNFKSFAGEQVLESPCGDTVEIASGDQTVYSRISHDRSHEVLWGDTVYFRTKAEPLLNRAWVFQERLLSRRTLHFAASELLWECRTGCFCECTRIGHAHSLSLRNLNSNTADQESDGASLQSLYRFGGLKKVVFFDVCSGQSDPQLALDFWLRIVEEYSFLFLSRESDRAIALAGIAKRIQKLAGPTYLAGLWAVDLPRALLWAPYPNKKVVRAAPGIPSWSWISRNCEPYNEATTCSIRYKHVTEYPFSPDPRLKIHEEGTFCIYEQGNPLGTPISGQLCMSAASCWGTVQVVPGKKSERRNRRSDLQVSLEPASNGVPLAIPFLADHAGKYPESLRLTERVLCILIGSRESPGDSSPQFLLVLAPVPDREGFFERIGFSESPGNIFPATTAAVRTVTII